MSWAACIRGICLAAGVAILLAAQAEAQQRPDRPPAWMRNTVGKVLDRLRAFGERAPPAQSEVRRSNDAQPQIARLPRPRPQSADPLASSASMAPPALDMPEDYEAVGLVTSERTLPLPLGVEPRPGLGDGQPQGSWDEDEPLVEPADADAAFSLVARVPRPRPSDAPTLLALTDPRDGAESTTALPEPLPELETDTEHATCLLRLAALRVEFTKVEPISEDGCRLSRPLIVSTLGSGVAIAPEAVMTCPTAEALARWVREDLVPAARTELDSVPTKIVHASAFVCRTRNGEPGGRMSEHSRGNAVDISSIVFTDREPVVIGSGDEAARRFEAKIRRGACAHFTTVLGPGSDAAHAAHFHFDLAERRGGYRLCDLGDANVADAPENTKRE